MKRFMTVCLSVGLLMSSSWLSAQTITSNPDSIAMFLLDATVVTATRTDTPLKNVASSMTLITEVDIERSGKTSVLDVLREQSGIDIVQSGGSGKNTSLFLRGAESDYVLFLVDGVEMNDPISTTRGYDLANLNVDQIERIEILRGPQFGCHQRRDKYHHQAGRWSADVVCLYDGRIIRHGARPDENFRQGSKI